MLAAVAPFASRARQAMDQAVDDAKRQANNFYLNMSLGKFMESELPPLRMPDGSLAPQQKPQGGQGEEQQSMVSPVTTLIPVSESAGSSAELSVASTRANRQSVYDIPVDLVMDRVDRYSTGAVVGREGGVSGLERRLSVLELSSGGMGANTGFGAIFGSPSSQVGNNWFSWTSSVLSAELILDLVSSSRRKSATSLPGTTSSSSSHTASPACTEPGASTPPKNTILTRNKNWTTRFPSFP